MPYALWGMQVQSCNRKKAFRKEEDTMEARLKVRMSTHDAHYGGNLVDGARVLNLFGDVATELLIRYDGDEGLFRAYSSIEFLAPVYAGDFIEIVGRIVEVGNTSRTMDFEAWKVISPAPDFGETAARVLAEPILVCKATGTCVTPRDKQRIEHDD
jgi:3-aminobutyryl-CoA ammonia-lyase